MRLICTRMRITLSKKRTHSRTLNGTKKNLKKSARAILNSGIPKWDIQRRDNPIKTEYNQGSYNAASVMFYKSKNFGDKFVFYCLEQKGTNKTHRRNMFGHTSPGYVASSVNGKWFVPERVIPDCYGDELLYGTDDNQRQLLFGGWQCERQPL